MRVTIFGGTGPIGRGLVRALRGNADIIVVSRSTDLVDGDHSLSHAKFLKGDFRDPSIVKKAAAGADAVVHLVTCSSPSKFNETPLIDLDANVRPTLTLLETCIEIGVRYVVFASSGGTVYGETEGKPMSENSGTLPVCAYGASKLAIEKYLHIYSLYHDLSYAALRVSSPYGIDSRLYPTRGVVDTFVESALAQKEITIWGDGSAVRDFIHLSDVARAFAETLRLRPSNVVMNIGSGIGTTLVQLLSFIEDVTGHSINASYHSSQQYDVKSIVLDCSFALEHLGWRSTRPLLIGIEETYSVLASTVK